MVYNILLKEGINKRKVTLNQQLKKHQKSKIYSSSLDNILVANLVDMQLISRYNKEIRFLI